MSKTPKYLPRVDKAMSAEEADEGDACCPTCGQSMVGATTPGDKDEEMGSQEEAEEAPSTFAKKFMAHKRGEA